MTIGQRIKQARRSNKLSLRDLAGQAEISPMAISKYERDQDIPSSGVLLRLSEALGVKIDFFFRPMTTEVRLEAFRKHAALGVKEQKAIQMRIQDWVERYLEVESLFPDEQRAISLPVQVVNSFEQVEIAALELRQEWNLGVDPIENMIQLLEDQGIKVGLVSGFEHFDACTFMADRAPVIVSKADLSGDRQRFNLGHELGHLVLNVQGDLNPESACHRFVGAFLAPAQVTRFELGSNRTALDMNELFLLKHKYGLSMQAWIFRAKDLGIISPGIATRLFGRFRANNWHRKEPGNPFPIEKPRRMERLIYRALAEDLFSRSRAQELLGDLLQPQWEMGALQQNGHAV
jgi:Zn-dependent peptidase ImmA (M78 family)/DNA-binding XRE family transcriptional regulator